MECKNCCCYGRQSDAPETVEETCMYIPEEDEDYKDYTPPCFREVKDRDAEEFER